LERLRELVRGALEAGEDLVLACSALKGVYRERLTVDAARQRWVYLHASRELIAERLKRRTGHYMSPMLLDSQLATLEVPRGALSVDVSTVEPDAVVATLLRELGLQSPT
jgi:gluconokinase